MATRSRKQLQLSRTETQALIHERQLLSNIQRGTQIGDFVAVCRTDYVQSFSDPWIARFDYRWVEYLFLVKNLLTKPDDLTALVFLPQDLSEVYYVVVPPQWPNYTHLTPRGRAEYELQPGYEQQVNEQLYKDYAAVPKRSIYHSVDPQGAGWDAVVDDVLTGRKQAVVVDYNGSRYNYAAPQDKKEAEASYFQAFATRRGAYPMEETLLTDRKYDIVPSIPDGQTGRVTVREFAADPKENAPFQRIAFQRTELKQGSVPPDHPLVMNHISFGDELGPRDSVIKHLQTKYVQLDMRNPSVKIVGYF